MDVWRGAESLEQEFDGVTVGGGGSFVKKTRDDKLIAGVFDRAPVTQRHSGIRDGKLETEMGDAESGEAGTVQLRGAARRDAGDIVENVDGARGGAMTASD